ncbi:MAG: lactate racemase domain-containing protein [Planctomycetota bacterium]|nr:lactate racemase domain-containing protein [Planctomycetota bacterium]
MTIAKSMDIHLAYGNGREFTCAIDAERVAVAFSGPAPNPEYREQLRKQLGQPLDFPALHLSVIPEDRVTIALDQNTPCVAGLIAEIWRVLENRGVPVGNVTIVQAVGDTTAAATTDPRAEIAEDDRESMHWVIHDPAGKDRCSYLATTNHGERVYLANEVVHADIVITVGTVGYDPLLGFRGTNSVLYPGLASADSLAKTRGQAQRELEPEDERPLRQTIDEVSWLLGNQFSVQVVPSTGGGISDVLAGASDAVFKRGCEVWKERWLLDLDERVDNVVLAMDVPAAETSWQLIGAVMESACRIVSSDGRIVVLSDAAMDLSEGFQIVRGCPDARDAFKPLRLETPADVVPATQWANAVDWARVYLLSGLDADVVEDLFATPVDSPDEIRRLLRNGGDCAFIAAAQNGYARVRSD